MCDDLLHAARDVNPARDFDDAIWGLGLSDIAVHLQGMGGRILVEFNLPVELANAVGALSVDLLVQQERDRYTRAEQAALLAASLDRLNAQQRVVYDDGMAAVQQDRGGALDGGNVFDRCKSNCEFPKAPSSSAASVRHSYAQYACYQAAQRARSLCRFSSCCDLCTSCSTLR